MKEYIRIVDEHLLLPVFCFSSKGGEDNFQNNNIVLVTEEIYFWNVSITIASSFMFSANTFINCINLYFISLGKIFLEIFQSLKVHSAVIKRIVRGIEAEN